MDKLLARAFGNLKLFCLANRLSVQGVRGFTILNMHASRGAYPFLGCKGSDTVVILKWLKFLAALFLHDESRNWSAQDKQVLTWMHQGSKSGLAFTQGIHRHSVWKKRSCVGFHRHALHKFGVVYAKLAEFSLRQGYTLFGMVPKLHALMHFRNDCDQSLEDHREWKLNEANFDNSMSEDFIGRIARQSRRISFRRIERSILLSYQTKFHFVIQKFKKRHFR